LYAWWIFSLWSINLSIFNTKSVTDMSNMFNGCSSLTLNVLSNFNSINVSNVFTDCSLLITINLFNFNNNRFINMSMFNDCLSLLIKKLVLLSFGLEYLPLNELYINWELKVLSIPGLPTIIKGIFVTTTKSNKNKFSFNNWFLPISLSNSICSNKNSFSN